MTPVLRRCLTCKLDNFPMEVRSQVVLAKAPLNTSNLHMLKNTEDNIPNHRKGIRFNAFSSFRFYRTACIQNNTLSCRLSIENQYLCVREVVCYASPEKKTRTLKLKASTHKLPLKKKFFIFNCLLLAPLCMCLAPMRLLLAPPLHVCLAPLRLLLTPLCG